MRTRIACIALAAMTLALAACGETDKAGGSGDEVTLRIGTDDGPNKPAAKAIEEFARQAERLSGGKIRVRPVYQAAGKFPEDWDQKVARLVAKGELDGAMVPARAWDTEGVMTLRALSAPFLLTSEEAVNRVVSGPLASELLAGLGEAGVVGLALVPEGLRHPFGFEKPLLGPDDYRGKGFRTPLSETTFALFRALGARPDDPNGPDVDRQIAAGRLAGADTSFVLSSSLPAKVATGNVTFFPKVNSLVVNEDAFEDLSDEQRSQLREAAERTRDWAIKTMPSDAEAAQAFCEVGGRVVLAGDDEVAALAAAARPVYAELERDERTAALIEKVRSVADAHPSADVATCEGGTPAAQGGSDDADGEGGIPSGVYRTELSVDQLVERGMDASTAREYNGVHTLKLLADGTLEDHVDSDKAFPACTGTYESTAATLELTFSGETCSGGFKAKWELRDGMLSLTGIESGTAEETAITRLVFGTEPFKKID